MSDSTHGYMYVSERHSICANWESYKGYTVRPLDSTEKYYSSVLKRFGSPQMQLLIFGATPEIRNCILEAGAKVTIVDRSAVMVESMGLLTAGRRPLNENEEFLEADWCNIPLPPSYADIAFGDDAINMLDWNKFEAFLAMSHRLLKPGGLFACHLLVRPDKAYRDQSALDVMRDYRAGLIHSKYDLASRINFTAYDEQSYRMGWQRSINCLHSLIEQGAIDTDHGFIEQFRNCNSSFTCPPQAEWEDLVCRYFCIEEIFYPEEHDYCRFEPLYLLRKQS